MIASPAEAAGFELSDDELKAYRQNGFLLRTGVFGAQTVSRLQAAAERAVEAARHACETGATYRLDGKRFVDAGSMTVQFEHRPDSDTLRVIEPVHGLDPELEALVDDPRLVIPMCQLVGSARIALWTDKLNLKRPKEGSAFGWHQDAPYWVHACGHVDRLPNVMVTFDDATEENGCFRVIRGSHRSGCLPGTADGTQLGGFYTDPGSFDLEAQVLMTAPAGSAIFFDPYTVHGSLPNRSALPRRAMIITYQPAGHPMLKTGRVRDVPGSKRDIRP